MRSKGDRMKNNTYRRTDLASECKSEDIEFGRESNGIQYEEKMPNGICVTTLDVLNDFGVQIIGKPVGRYVTVNVGKVWNLSGNDLTRRIDLLADEIRTMLDRALNGKSFNSILAVGLGNRYITSDAIGHEVLKNIIVTRHMKEAEPSIYKLLGGRAISAIAPGVIGQTGIETLELIQGVVKSTDPDAVIVIDALAAVDVSHLATTVQITDAGIEPGSGIGNRRLAIDRKSLNRPVIVIGVPTVVESSTLVYGALEEAGICEISDNLKKVLDNGRGYYVTPKESDIVTTEVSKLLADAINAALA